MSKAKADVPAIIRLSPRSRNAKHSGEVGGGRLVQAPACRGAPRLVYAFPDVSEAMVTAFAH